MTEFLFNLMTLSLILAFTGVIPLSIETSSWYIETVDSVGSITIEKTSIAVDSCGNVHICYPDGPNLMWARRIGASWHLEIVDPASNPNSGISLALDRNGIPHISYTASTDLKYAKWLGPSLWSIQTLGPGASGSECWQSSLAMDSNNYPHIAFQDRGSSPDTLNYTYWTGTAWINYTIDYGGYYLSLALDSNDNPHIAYSSDGLKYAYWNGSRSAWNIETVDPASSPMRLSLALDSIDSPRIVYFENEFGLLKHATYAQKTGWSIYTVDNASGVGWFPSLDIDSAGNSHISYADVIGESLEYATGKDDTWSKETVDTAGVGRHTSIVVDSKDTPHISYIESTNFRLKYAGVVGEETNFAITGAVLSKNIVGQGYNVIVNSTLVNSGSDTEIVDITLYANKTFVMSQSFSVEPGEPTAASLTWSTGSFTKGDYNIKVTVAIDPCEINVEDNSFLAGSLLVTIPGDVDGDKDVDIFDIVKIAGVYGQQKSDPSYEVNNDIDGDGDIDIFDIVAAAGHYGESWNPLPPPRRIYVVNGGDNTVSVIDNTKLADGITGNEVIEVIDLDFDGWSNLIAVDESRNLVYVANAMAGTMYDQVSVIDETTIYDGVPNNEVIDTLALDADPYPPLCTFWGVAVCEYHQVIWATIPNLFGILAFDGVARELMPEGQILIHSLPDNALPLAVDVDEIHHRVYIADGEQDDVDVIDEYRLVDGIFDNEVIDSIAVGEGAFGLAVDELRNRIYVANQVDGTVSVIDGSKVNDGIPANEVMMTIDVGDQPSHIAVDELRNMIYVTNQLDGTVSVIDGSKVSDKISGNEVVDTVTVGNAPLGIAVDETNNRIYVANHDDNTVSVINGYLIDDGTTANEVIATIDVGTDPNGLAVSTYSPP